nr:hypothetical protein [Tanacetum cinerariifolium]
MTMAQTLIKMKSKKARLLDEQRAKRLHDEEVEQAAAKEKQEKSDLDKAKGLQQHYDEKHENIDWNIVAKQIQEKHLDNIRKYRILKIKPVSIAQAWKNMIIYLKNMAGYKMEHSREKDYSLSNAVMIMMLSAKLQVEKDSEMARDLVMKIFMKANKPKSRRYCYNVYSSSARFSSKFKAINDWSDTLYALGDVLDPNMMNDVHVGNMPDNDVILDLSLDTHILVMNTDVLPTHGRVPLEEILQNLGFTIWSENQVLIGANEELRALVLEMRKRESVIEHLSDDLQDVILAWDNQISSYMNEIDQLCYKRRMMLCEILRLGGRSFPFASWKVLPSPLLDGFGCNSRTCLYIHLC